MQTPKASFNMPNFLEPNVVQVRLGQSKLAMLPQLQKGDVLQGLVGQVSQGKGQINIAGESVTLEGLNKTFQHKNISIKVLQTQPLILLELTNKANSHKQEPLQSNKPKVPHSKAKDVNKAVKNTMLSKPFTAHTTTALPNALKNKEHAHFAIVSNKQGSKATLIISSVNNTSTQLNTPHNNSKTDARQRIEIGGRFSDSTLETAKNTKKSPLPPLQSHVQTHHTIVTNKQISKEALTIPSTSNATTQQPSPLHNGSKESSTHRVEISSAKRPLQIGERFSVRTIDSSKNTSQILLTPLDSRVQTGTKDIPSYAQLGTLPAGKIITASVAKRLVSGHVVLHWQQQRFEAAAPAHVRAGDLLQLEVRPNNKPDNPSLRVVEHLAKSKVKAAQLLQQHIGKSSSSQHLFNTLRHISPNIAGISSQNPTNNTGNQALTQSMSNLQQWSEQHTLNPEKGMGGAHVAKLMQHIGQHYEASLLQHRHDSLQQLQHLKQHDLKALLLQLSHHADAATNSSEHTQIKQVAERGLAHIESQQALNILSILQTDPIRFELPMMVQGQWVSVWLSIQQEMHDAQETAKQQQNASHHILFALDLSALGALRIDAHIAEKSVHATFYHDNEKARLFVQENTPRLQEKLKNIGFEDIFIHTGKDKQLSDKKKQQFEQLLNHMPSRDGLLDMQA